MKDYFVASFTEDDSFKKENRRVFMVFVGNKKTITGSISLITSVTAGEVVFDNGGWGMFLVSRLVTFLTCANDHL